MYIYIGSDYLIDEEEVVGMFDIETTTTSYITRDYLTEAQKKGRIVNASEIRTWMVPLARLKALTNIVSTT